MNQHVRSAYPAWRALLGAGLAGLFAASGCAPGARAAEVRNVSERVFPLDPGGQVVVKSQNGRIVVEAWDRPDVRVQITRVIRADDEKRAAELMRGLMVDVDTSPASIRLTSRYPKRHEEIGIWAILVHKVEALNVHYYLQVPKQSSLNLRTSNGEIRIRGALGTVNALTVNGDVELTGAAGPADVRTTNGEVRLTGISGSAIARTTNGGVTADVASLPKGGVVNLQTTNGDVDVRLPKDVAATVEATTTNGKVNLDFPVVSQGRLTTKSIRGTIGGGGARVSLQTTNGNVDLSPAPPARAR
ncbi:MAG TPA: DUF4097 family beta strand repeat-containing protein [Candidatus Eisenbacteria bacterium]